MTEPGNILIVDDETNIRSGLLATLKRDGHQVTEASSGEEALAILARYPCEAAIVDIRMPGMSGVDLLHEINTRWSTIAVILLTGHGTLDTAVHAVREGAYDYLLKPAQPDAIRQAVKNALVSSRRRREESKLIESVRSSLQRIEQLPADAGHPSHSSETHFKKTLLIGDLHIDLASYEVFRDGDLISLTPSEFRLLVNLASRPGETFDYATLVKRTLDYETEPWEAKELIKRHVFALRHKIEPEPSIPRYILNIRGVGYRLAIPEKNA